MQIPMDNNETKKIKRQITKKKKSLKQTLEEYQQLNSKLNKGLDVSLTMIVDLSMMLKHYHELVKAIQSFVDEPIQMADDVKTLADKAHQNLTKTFEEQMDDIISAYDSGSDGKKSAKALKKKILKALKQDSEKEKNANKKTKSK